VGERTQLKPTSLSHAARRSFSRIGREALGDAASVVTVTTALSTPGSVPRHLTGSSRTQIRAVNSLLVERCLL
jgi:hypothetical protein